MKLTSITKSLSLALLLTLSTSASEVSKVHWEYNGAGAPSNWGDLKPEFQTCKDGVINHQLI